MSNRSSLLIPGDSEVADLNDDAIGREGSSQSSKAFLLTVTILSILVLAPAMWARWIAATNSPTVDFFSFWSATRLLHDEPAANIYLPETQLEMGSRALLQAQSPSTSNLQREATTVARGFYNGRIDATCSPLLYALVGALSSGDFPTDQKRFLFASMACLVASLLLLGRLLRFNTFAAALLLLFIFTNYKPFLEDTRVGNVNDFQLLGVVLFIFFTARSQPLLAGLTIGAATAFKPTTFMVLALSVIAGLADREYEELLYMLLGCSAAFTSCAIAAAAYFHKPAMWSQFLHSLPKTLSGTATYPLERGNFSLSALLFDTATPRSLGIPAILLIVFSWLFFSTRRAKHSSVLFPKEADARVDTAFCVGGCGCAVTLLSSPLTWAHYYLLLLPLSVYLLFSEGGQDAPASGNARRTLALILPFVPLVMFSLSLLQIVKYVRPVCVLTISAAVLTLAMASYRIWKRRCSLPMRSSVP